MDSLIHLAGLYTRNDRGNAPGPRATRARENAHANAGSETRWVAREPADRPVASRFYRGRVYRIEHALFAVILVTVGYVYLGALLAEAL